MIDFSTPVVSVTQLNRHIRQWLENEITEILVEGEISNLSKPSSGHCYFTLKDTGAQVRCVCFKNKLNPQIQLENGLKLIIVGKITLYEQRGDYQILVHELRPSGLGDLHQQFEQLKLKLKALGLFDHQRKKNLPAFPFTIGVITSSNGAALHDILTTLNARYPCAKVYIYAVEVQGKQAAQQIINAIMTANQQPCCEVLILARGGGSLEDLWSFNNEQLAFTIAESRLPIITGIGHETDFTIADFVADYRAATPTAAACHATPNRVDLLLQIDQYSIQLLVSIKRYLKFQQQQCQQLTQRLVSPIQLLGKYWQTLDYVKSQLFQYMIQNFNQHDKALMMLQSKLHKCHPLHQLKQRQYLIQAITQQLKTAIKQYIQAHKSHTTQLMNSINLMSPLKTLDRGFAIVSLGDKVIHESNALQLEQKVHIKLAKGSIEAIVKSIDHDQ